VSARRSVRFQIVLGVVVLVGLAFVFVFPTSSWWEQRQEIRRAEQRVELLRSERENLERERDRLSSDEQIERLARERFNLVKPGETAWAVVPGPETPAEPPPASAAEETDPSVTDGGSP